VVTKKLALSFLKLEELGTQVPNQCPSHVNYKECSIRTLEMTRKEQAELPLIENMTLDKEAKVIRVRNPYVRDPAVLSNNKWQAI
jgi:hypothetical protein